MEWATGVALIPAISRTSHQTLWQTVADTLLCDSVMERATGVALIPPISRKRRQTLWQAVADTLLCDSVIPWWNGPPV